MAAGSAVQVEGRSTSVRAGVSSNGSVSRDLILPSTPSTPILAEYVNLTEYAEHASYVNSAYPIRCAQARRHDLVSSPRSAASGLGGFTPKS